MRSAVEWILWACLVGLVVMIATAVWLHYVGA
jgi:hypothetical protein